MALSPFLECRDIAFERDDVPLFSAVSLALHSGEAVQVRGANGVGKTTLLRILATSLSASHGHIRHRGQSLNVGVGAEISAYRQDLLYLGHATGVKLALTARENLAWYFHIYPGNGSSIDAALAKVGLAGYEDVPCQTLSAGQLRRVALARLYLSCAPLWILDEPFTSIDVKGVADLEATMASHLVAGGSLVLTSHQPLGVPGLRFLDLEQYG